MRNPVTAKFAIVIQTDSYGGNFEREMCAYTTGHIGECYVGANLVDVSIYDKFSGYICEEADDSGCYRPVGLGCDIEGYTNQDVVIFFHIKPTTELIDIIKERLVDFAIKEKIKVSKIDLLIFNMNFNVEHL
jgi:hypothetical protein